MRRQLRIRVEFAPTRLSTEYLKRAYEVVVPVARRVTSQQQPACANEMPNQGECPPAEGECQ
jgi:hypothetical protein